MFGDPVKNPHKFHKVSIRDLVSEVKYGTSEKSGEVGKYPILRMNNITYKGGWDFTELKYTDIKPSDEEKYLVKNGDMLFNRTNSKELVGKTAVYRRDIPIAYAGYLVRVRSNSENNTEYISAYLNSIYGKKVLLNMCKSIVGMANINAQEMQDIEILKPPLELQNKFAQIVEKVEDQKAKNEVSTIRLDELFNSLLQRAFKGELEFNNDYSNVVEVFSM